MELGLFECRIFVRAAPVQDKIIATKLNPTAKTRLCHFRCSSYKLWGELGVYTTLCICNFVVQRHTSFCVYFINKISPSGPLLQFRVKNTSLMITKTIHMHIYTNSKLYISNIQNHCLLLEVQMDGWPRVFKSTLVQESTT